jgi:hypothetical protein
MSTTTARGLAVIGAGSIPEARAFSWGLETGWEMGHGVWGRRRSTYPLFRWWLYGTNSWPVGSE